MTTLPRPSSRPSYGPPNTALPALPVGKSRKSTGALPTPSSRALASTPKSGLRAPSSSFLPPTIPAPTSALPQPRSASSLQTPGKTIRKTVSISSFPQPPRGDNRVTNLPASPLSRPSSSRKSKPSPTGSGSGNPSFLNGSAEGKAVSTNAGNRASDGVISVSSPPQSRSSSAQDSYSTSATQYDDDAQSHNEKRSLKHDGKGNVIVSVRARPDAGNGDKSSGEWTVDGKNSMVGYCGREGGDYYYGT